MVAGLTGPPPGNTTGSGSGGGSHNHSHGGVTNKNHQQYVADLEASMRTILQRWNMSSPALNKLIKQASANNWNADLFMQAVERTKQFHQQYPGIFNSHGGLKMQPEQYIAQQSRFKDMALAAGVDLNKQDYANLFKNNVSLNEFHLRASADAVLQQNQTLFDNFNQELKAQGMPPMNQTQQTKYIMGLGASKYYDVWENANASTQASYTGMDLNRQDVLNIVKYERGQNPDTGRVNLGQQASQFAKLAQDYRTVAGQSKIQGFNLSKDDLNQLEFGGPKQAQVAQTVAQLMANQKGFESQSISNMAGNVGARGRLQRV